jgi:hypothetical protein
MFQWTPSVLAAAVPSASGLYRIRIRSSADLTLYADSDIFGFKDPCVTQSCRCSLNATAAGCKSEPCGKSHVPSSFSISTINNILTNECMFW